MLAIKLNDLLLRERIVSHQSLEKAIEESKAQGLRLVDALLKLKLIDESSLISFLSKQYRLTVMDLSNYTVSPELFRLVPPPLLKKHKILPVAKKGSGSLVIAVSDPTNIQALDDVSFHSKLKVEQVLALPSNIQKVIERSLQDPALANFEIRAVSESQETDDSPIALKSEQSDAPVINYVSKMLTDAINAKASDIHFEPFATSVKIRFRMDGSLVDIATVNADMKAPLAARLKIMAKLRIDEKRLPQDGRIQIRMPDNRLIDFRVNTLPTVFGEKVVLRILDKSNATMQFEQLGFEKDDLEKFREAVRRPWGMCLVTGATGSGKTTTLYAAINELNKVDVNISTLEDPVEYNFVGINQTPIREAIGLSFPEGLRALLRQDPDIILLGEIRDKETAEVAMKAALTGHMVLSTLHTNDAASSIMRLEDMGIEPFLINAALQAILAQRLLRRVCVKCANVDTRYTSENFMKMGFPENIIGKFKPMLGKGCSHCNQTGYKGRVAIHEIMMMTDSIREKIVKGASTQEIRKQAIVEGMRPLRVNAMKKVISGITSIDEMQGVER